MIKRCKNCGIKYEIKYHSKYEDMCYRCRNNIQANNYYASLGEERKAKIREATKEWQKRNPERCRELWKRAWEREKRNPERKARHARKRKERLQKIKADPIMKKIQNEKEREWYKRRLERQGKTLKYKERDPEKIKQNKIAWREKYKKTNQYKEWRKKTGLNIKNMRIEKLFNIVII